MTKRGIGLARLLVVGFLLAFAAAQSPHLVHHLFEHAEALADCPFATAPDRLAAVSSDVVPPPLGLDLQAQVDVAPLPAVARGASAPADARAPPVFAS